MLIFLTSDFYCDIMYPKKAAGSVYALHTAASRRGAFWKNGKIKDTSGEFQLTSLIIIFASGIFESFVPAAFIQIRSSYDRS